MRPIQIKKPTTGFLVAVTALVVALGGTAVAAQQDDAARAGKSDAAAAALTKKQVKKIAKKQANKAITQRAPGLTVAKAALADNATNATNATKASLADNATNATNALNAAQVGSLNVKKFSVSVPSGAGSAVAVSEAGLTLRATCAASLPQLGATSSVAGSKIRALSVDDGETVYTNGTSDLSTFGTLPTISATTLDWGSGFVEYTAAGANVNVWLGYRVDGGVCNFYGNYISG
jgi:hypothetical protein